MLCIFSINNQYYRYIIPKMKGNDTKNCVYNETTNIKNIDMIDTSSVFHSNCSTLNCSKQDFPIDDLTVSTFKKNDNNQCKKFFIFFSNRKENKKNYYKDTKSYNRGTTFFSQLHRIAIKKSNR